MKIIEKKRKEKSFFDTMFVREHQQSELCVILALEKEKKNSD